MRTVPRGNYSWSRVGVSKWIRLGLPAPIFFERTGRAQQEPGGPVYEEWQFRGYPLVIDRDTLFEGVNFTQARPHTSIFKIAPGVRVVFRQCPAVNVTLPAEIAPGDFTGNNQQGTHVETGNPDRPTVFLFCECEKCATYRAALVADIKSGAWDAGATIIDAKAVARERRKNPVMVAADVEAQRAGNEAALAEKRAFRAPVAEGVQ